METVSAPEQVRVCRQLCGAHDYPPYFTPCSPACDVLGCWYERGSDEAEER